MTLLVLRRLRTPAAVAGSLAVIGLLWLYRPPWPRLPPSVAAPLTVASIEQIALLAAWVVAGIVVIVLLLQRVAHSEAHRRVVPGGEQMRRASAPRAGRPTSTSARVRLSVSAAPELLVAAPRDDAFERPAPAPGETPHRASQVAGQDHRPLVSLLGPLTIEGATRSRRGLRARALELIAFLSLQKQGAQRDEILEALWPGEDPKRSSHRFYQALRDARRLLGDAVASERDRYWLDRGRVRVDLDEFERTLADATQANTEEERARLLAQAVALIRGHALAALDYPWADAPTRRLRALMTSVFERMGSLHLQRGEPAAALDLAERGIELDRYNEALERLAMNAEAALELRQAILDRFDRLSGRLNELGLEPERETRSLYHQLLGQG